MDHLLPRALEALGIATEYQAEAAAAGIRGLQARELFALILEVGEVSSAELRRRTGVANLSAAMATVNGQLAAVGDHRRIRFNPAPGGKGFGFWKIASPAAVGTPVGSRSPSPLAVGDAP